mmetsp:Transcript_13951/g.35254  ORF Transcript_13951/g.35254 Transcript_13951/m.35254 type:complete len:247 (-) Transcript_13951:469-1209(-)
MPLLPRAAGGRTRRLLEAKHGGSHWLYRRRLPGVGGAADSRQLRRLGMLWRGLGRAVQRCPGTGIFAISCRGEPSLRLCSRDGGSSPGRRGAFCPDLPAHVVLWQISADLHAAPCDGFYASSICARYLLIRLWGCPLPQRPIQHRVRPNVVPHLLSLWLYSSFGLHLGGLKAHRCGRPLLMAGYPRCPGCRIAFANSVLLCWGCRSATHTVLHTILQSSPAVWWRHFRRLEVSGVKQDRLALVRRC